MKPTIFYSLCGIICYIGAVNDKFFIKDILVDVKMDKINWVILSKRIALLSIVLAILNESVWRILGQNAEACNGNNF